MRKSWEAHGWTPYWRNLTSYLKLSKFQLIRAFWNKLVEPFNRPSCALIKTSILTLFVGHSMLDLYFYSLLTQRQGYLEKKIRIISGINNSKFWSGLNFNYQSLQILQTNDLSFTQIHIHIFLTKGINI